MKLGSWIGWVVPAVVAVGLLSFGCETIFLNDVPGGQGWGVGAGMLGTGGGGAQGGAGAGGGLGGYGGNEMCGSAPCFCYECHGDPVNLNTAPPPDIDGNTEISSPSVGAHQAHLRPSAWHITQGCSQCHIVPTSASEDPLVPTHFNNATDIDWGTLATVGGLNPVYDTTSRTCTNTYCHGASLPIGGQGGAGSGGGEPGDTTPLWTTVDGTHSECGVACHRNPPQSPAHLDTDTDCERATGCHGGVMTFYDEGNPAASTWQDSDAHINGIIDFDPP